MGTREDAGNNTDFIFSGVKGNDLFRVAAKGRKKEERSCKLMFAVESPRDTQINRSRKKRGLSSRNSTRNGGEGGGVRCSPHCCNIGPISPTSA